jgi:hypothetical protein
VRDLVEVEVAAPRAARVFLFLLPTGRPRRRGDEGVAADAGAVFLPLPFGRPGPRFSETPASPGALAARVATEVEGATVAAAARASRVFLLRLPFGRPRFRAAGVTRVNSTNVLDEGLRIREIGRQMNSKVKVSQNKCISKVNLGVQPGLLSICPTPSPPGPYI